MRRREKAGEGGRRWEKAGDCGRCTHFNLEDDVILNCDHMVGDRKIEVVPLAPRARMAQMWLATAMKGEICGDTWRCTWWEPHEARSKCSTGRVESAIAAGSEASAWISSTHAPVNSDTSMSYLEHTVTSSRCSQKSARMRLWVRALYETSMAYCTQPVLAPETSPNRPMYILPCSTLHLS